MTDLVRLANLISRINLTIADITNNAGDADPEQAIAVLREAAADLTRLRAIEKAARVVAENWTVEDCSPNMRSVWRFEHESLRAALREKGADCGCPERDRTDERPHPPTQNSVRGDPGKFETEPEVDEGAWIVVTLVLVPVFVIALFALLRVASR